VSPLRFSTCILRSCKLNKNVCTYLYRLFLAAQRTASLRHDDEAQAALINSLLKSYISYHLYDQADKLVSKTTFPTSASNAQFARYHYYLGRIKMVQLNYTDAHTNLQQAIRRAPPPKTAPGFYQAVHKYFIVVELLMGDIPDRSLFRHVVLEKALTAYFDIVKGKLLFFAFLIQQPLNNHCLHNQLSAQAPSLNSKILFPSTFPNLKRTILTLSSSDFVKTLSKLEFEDSPFPTPVSPSEIFVLNFIWIRRKMLNIS
jgi:hypothetical protein